MDRRTIRAFAAGMIGSVLVIVSVTFFTASEESAGKMDASSLENEGYIVLTEEAHDALQAQLMQLEDELAVKETLNKEAVIQDETDEPTTRFILVIDSGMMSQEISESLERVGIIANATEFNSYLVEHEMTNRIQIGEYELTSQLSIEEIAALITRD
ncbi:hypothetical protein [Jeotgalibacillus soli]|uniref:Aminodeoxychorismate lyase n=1 Tax=Jeotgalibacillus soli TaxID=889306 RepID=A0A0C2R294_9BACL|nr:hypothetical protein [Jeotgalibacillus soli]KIL44405.1 hypothetical protein KP78_33690 [Jeotgalibacillus soli]